MRQLDLVRHAKRQNDVDALSEEGRLQAERLGMRLPADYAVVFVSPAYRAAQTVAWILRGSKQPTPDHAVVSGLTSSEENRWRAAGKASQSQRLDALRAIDPELVQAESTRMAGVVADLFEQVPEDGRGLAVGHTPLVEAAVLGLTGMALEPLAECEGVRLTRDAGGEYAIEELRTPA
ncbi:MAG TPA: phosphoglycerate mutase family protein [Actinomycetota bacterium]|jgi:broad specificity phosphatase PhoE